jgi:hypothetical protein
MQRHDNNVYVTPWLMLRTCVRLMINIYGDRLLFCFCKNKQKTSSSAATVDSPAYQLNLDSIIGIGGKFLVIKTPRISGGTANLQPIQADANRAASSSNAVPNLQRAPSADVPVGILSTRVRAKS